MAEVGRRAKWNAWPKATNQVNERGRAGAYGRTKFGAGGVSLCSRGVTLQFRNKAIAFQFSSFSSASTMGQHRPRYEDGGLGKERLPAS
jgi:hypothetical protein